jgi:flagellar motility protein MotE (MotC chaperone)
VNKKLLIIIAVAGLVTFGGTFFLGLKTKKAPPAAPTASHPAADANVKAMKLEEPSLRIPGQAAEIAGGQDIAEKQLKDLIYEVREKISEYDNKLKELELREKNLQAAKDTLKKDVNELDNLRIELTSTLSSIKTEQDKLEKTMVQITLTEESNLKTIAATYDKMDAAQAGKILANMNQSSRGSSADDAIKILYYMSERTKAKVLAAIAETEPAISANFCQRLKKISVKDK